MSNIKTLLEQDKEKAKQLDENSAVKDIKLLMQADETEDLRLIRGIASNSQMAIAQNRIGEKLELENLENKYAGNVFTTAQIRDLAIKYRLRFLKSNRFTGEMPIEVIAKIKAFAKETNTNISDAVVDRKFFILAPKENFKMVKTLQKKQRKPIDPAIFYKIDDNHYRLIHQWGADFSIFRRVLGAKWENWTNVTTFLHMKWFIAIMFIFGFIFPAFTLANLAWAGLIVGVISYIGARLHKLFMYGEGNYLKNMTTDSNWNNNQSNRWE